MDNSYLKNLLLIDGYPASLDEESFSSFHGNSVFTTFKTCKKEIQNWALHWRRLYEHAKYFNYNLPKEEEILNNILNNISKFNFDIKLRVILYKKHYAITFEKLLEINENIYQGVNVMISKQIVHPVYRYFKTGNSLPYLLAYEEAKENGFFEGLLLDHEGFLADGSRSGLFLCNKGKLTQILGGIKSVMGQVLIDTAQALGLKIYKKRLKPQNINGQLLLSNSLWGVVSVNPPADEIVRNLIDRHK